MVFESYGAEKHYDSHVGSTTYLLRFIKYSVPDLDAESSNSIGTNAHTDKSFLSILYQNQVNGLQIQLRNGEWVDIDVPPGSFIVMAGDAYEVLHLILCIIKALLFLVYYKFDSCFILSVFKIFENRHGAMEGYMQPSIES